MILFTRDLSPPIFWFPPVSRIVVALLFVGTVGAQVPVERANGEAARIAARVSDREHLSVCGTDGIEIAAPKWRSEQAVIEQQARFDARVRVDEKRASS